MLQSLLGSDPLRWVIDKYLLKKIQEVFAECCVTGNDVLLFVSYDHFEGRRWLTSNRFIAFTNLLEALEVSACG